MLANAMPDVLDAAVMTRLREPLLQVDIAYAASGQLLIYGWILGYSTEIATAYMRTSGLSLDLTKAAVPVARPDVAAHFAEILPDGGDLHGFYALVDLPTPDAELLLEVTLKSGVSLTRNFLIEREDAAADSGVIEPHLHTLDLLLAKLSEPEAHRLIRFAAPALPLNVAATTERKLDPPARMVIDLCCVLERRLLIIVGWMLDPFAEISDLWLEFDTALFDLSSRITTERPDLAPTFAPYRGIGGPRECGFMFAAPLAAPATLQSFIRLKFRWNQEKFVLRSQGETDPHAARQQILTFLGNADADAAVAMSAYLSRVVAGLSGTGSLQKLFDANAKQAMMRLPGSLQSTHPRHSVFVDQAIPIGNKGVFISGWFDAAPVLKDRLTLLCHCGEATFDVTAAWISTPRPDVAAHLNHTGVPVSGIDYGYLSFIPLDPTQGLMFFSLDIGDGQTKRMQLVLAKPQESPLQTIRSILTTFTAQHPRLRDILDQHIGPALSALWSMRLRPTFTPAVEHYGVPVADPDISLIVPLYGRHDFAEYQLALFADDADFRRIELIYVVDDPSLYAAFKNLCPGFFGMYRVPFTVVFAGLNLGFAGANNCGASIARGRHLVLMNSDVMPRRPGWASAMLETYARTADIGILGVKLLYENGSIQHAGMEFRRSSIWGDMWINYHPHKGQTAEGLTGLHEVPAVTAACILIDSSLYRALGGLSEEYIVGDFEDSDLCLRVAAAGRGIWVALDIELYHLERQSQNRVGDGVFRTNLSIYNCWQHQRRWSPAIEGFTQ